MATAVPQKNIDEIKSIREMMKVFELLHINFDEENLNLKEMKKKAKEKMKEQSSHGTTVSVLQTFNYSLGKLSKNLCLFDHVHADLLHLINDPFYIKKNPENELNTH